MNTTKCPFCSSSRIQHLGTIAGNDYYGCYKCGWQWETPKGTTVIQNTMKTNTQEAACKAN